MNKLCRPSFGLVHGEFWFFNDWQVGVILKYRSQFLVNKPQKIVLNLINWGKASNILQILYFKRRFFWRPPDVKCSQTFPLPPFHPLAFRIFNIGSGRAWKWNNNWAGDWSSVQFSPTHEYSNELSPDIISSFATSSTDQSKSHPFAHNSFSTHTQHSLSVVMFVGRGSKSYGCENEEDVLVEWVVRLIWSGLGQNGRIGKFVCYGCGLRLEPCFNCIPSSCISIARQPWP